MSKTQAPERYPRKSFTQKVRTLTLNTLVLAASLALMGIALASALRGLVGWP